MSERKIVNVRGDPCTRPLMELIAVLKLAAIGEEIEVLSNDPESAADIPFPNGCKRFSTNSWARRRSMGCGARS